MFDRDLMQKYRPVYAPDEPAAPAADAAAIEAAGDVAAAGGDAAAAAAQVAESAAAAGGDAPKVEAALLEAASAKAPEPAKADTKESPAPAEAAKPEGDKNPEGDVKDAKADDKPKAEDDKSAAKADPETKDATAAEPPAPIQYADFTLPEGTTLDPERLGKFKEIAGTGQVRQDVAQSLINLYLEENQRMATEIQKQAEQHQRDVWNKLNDTWKTEARNDPQIGGNRFDTSLSRAKAVIEEYGGSPEQVRDLLAHTTHNGMGNFPGFLRLLDNIAGALNVYEDSAVAANPNPPKSQRGPGDRGWYPSMNGGTPNT